MLPLCIPQLDEDDTASITQCINSGFVSSVGTFVNEFEQNFANFVGSRFAVACSSGTAAIHLALRALDIKPHDIVLVSDFTFIASANPIVYQGAIPIFVDSEALSWNMSPQKLDEKLQQMATVQLPKAVIVPHIYGQPAHLGPIIQICSQYNIPIVEDAAESLGAGYTKSYPCSSCAGKQVGTCGIMGCFSFNGNKVITSGGGGMVVTDDPKLAELCKHLSTQAKVNGKFYHDIVGYNYRMPNLNAALGLSQLRKLPQFLKTKQQIAQMYMELFDQAPVFVQPIVKHTYSSHWLNTVRTFMPSVSMLKIIKNIGLFESRHVWASLSTQPAFQHFKPQTNEYSNELYNYGFCLPSSVNLSHTDIKMITNTIKNILS